MKATFKTFVGLAGDSQTLLTATSEMGCSESTLISRTGCFQYWRMQNAKRKLLKQLEIRTGKKHIEDEF